MQIRTLRLLKVFILLIDLLIQLIKHGKETAEVIIILRRIIEDQLSVALYKQSKTDFFLTIKTSNMSKSLKTSVIAPEANYFHTTTVI